MADETVDTGTLPGALLEETFWPDHVVAIPNDDGSVHLLMYVGEQAEGFLSLKHAILSPAHGAGLGLASPEPDPGPTVLERAQSLPEPPPLPVTRAPVLDSDLIT